MRRPIVALQRGFSLIELMIVVAIMGIVASIALPQYQTYMVKSKVSEALTDMGGLKAAVTEAYSAGNNAFPPTSSPPISTSAPANATYVAAVAYNSTAPNAASVVLTLGNTNNPNVDGKFLGIFGTGEADGSVLWQCGTATAANSTAPGTLTNMYPFLPVACKN